MSFLNHDNPELPTQKCTKCLAIDLESNTYYRDRFPNVIPKEFEHLCYGCFLTYYKASARKKVNGMLYLMTFTRNPNSRYSKESWLERVKKELSKNFIEEFAAALEHKDTNIHCHACVKTTKLITKREFKVFIRDYGFVDLRRVNDDNGVVPYISKDLPEGEVPAYTVDQLIL